MILVTIILLFFLGNVRAALIVALTIPFSLLFASILLDLSRIPANLLSLGALDFGMVVDGAVVMVETSSGKWRAAKAIPPRWTPTPGPSGPPRTRCSARVLRDRHHHHRLLPIFTLERIEGRLFRPMAWTVAFALLGALTFSILIAPVLASVLFRGGVRERQNPLMTWLTGGYRNRCAGPSSIAGSRSRRHCRAGGGLLSRLQRRDRFGVPASPDEGAIWARGTLATSTSLTEGTRFAARPG